MAEVNLIVGSLGSALFATLGVSLYFQRKLFRLTQEKSLFQERSNRLPELEALLMKKEEDVRLQGERNAELRVALQRTEKEGS